MRGRKPTPTQLKILYGNPGKRPLNPHEPRPRRGVPSCPRQLDAEARKEWRRVVLELDAIGLLTHIDRAELAAYCQNWSRWMKLEGIVQRTGEVLVEKRIKRKQRRDGTEEVEESTRLYPSPHLGALNRALRNMHAFASEFGMSPASRVRLAAPLAYAEGDELETFLRESS